MINKSVSLENQCALAETRWVVLILDGAFDGIGVGFASNLGSDRSPFF